MRLTALDYTLQKPTSKCSSRSLASCKMWLCEQCLHSNTAMYKHGICRHSKRKHSTETCCCSVMSSSMTITFEWKWSEASLWYTPETYLMTAGFFLLSEASGSVSKRSWRSAGDRPRLRCLLSPPFSSSDLYTHDKAIVTTQAHDLRLWSCPKYLFNTCSRLAIRLQFTLKKKNYIKRYFYSNYVTFTVLH